jgi:glycosyltransferase involved in cell wall biosynthesis
MYKNKKLSVVVPAYKEELLIGQTLTTMPDYIDKIYVVDDDSPDRTYEIAKEFAIINPRIHPIKHPVNRGVGAGIVTGYKASIKDEIDIAIVMAGDNQMDPVYIPALVDPIIEDSADYTKGNRLFSVKDMNGMSYFRRFGNFVLTALTKISSGYWDIGDPQNGYTAISSKALREVDLDEVYPSYGYCNDLLAKLNVHDFRVMDINIPARYGNEKSKIRYGNYMINVSKLLLHNFFWRIKIKYFKMDSTPTSFYTLTRVFKKNNRKKFNRSTSGTSGE